MDIFNLTGFLYFGYWDRGKGGNFYCFEDFQRRQDKRLSYRGFFVGKKGVINHFLLGGKIN